MLESELFGHVRGSFTGAIRDKKGKFEEAHGGTIFLDDINYASPNLQIKLLRVLQEKVIERVGGNIPIRTDVRIITATNTPLQEEVAPREFREDLYYRINVVHLNIPPLRERLSDIEPLAITLSIISTRYTTRDSRASPRAPCRSASGIPGPAMSGNWKMSWNGRSS